MPRNLSIQRIVALVNALAKLHNFCIDQQDEVGGNSGNIMMQSSVTDSFNFMNGTDGFVTLDQVGEEYEGDFIVPNQLLNGGNHFEDVPRNLRNPRGAMGIADKLPRKGLHDKVLESHKVRPSTRRLR